MTKIALLSNINIDPLKNQLQKYDLYNLYTSGYNQWQSDLLNPSSEMYAFNPDFVFIYLNADEFKQEISELLSSIYVFCVENTKTQFIISNFSHQPYSISTYLSKNENIDIEMNQQLKNYATTWKNIFIFDFNRLISLHGYVSLFDEKYWYLGRIKFSNHGFKVIAEEINHVLNCLSGKTKKVLILDLDNTIWGGIAGEDGWQNLHISDEGIGKIYSDFQKNIKQLSQLGIILALCSKNNEKDAHEVFEKNLNMQLHWNDFTVRLINWNHKPDNILTIADKLNLGIDSFVFIDDNPAERELVRNLIPQIVVPEFPKDITKLNQWFINDVVYPYFNKKDVTIEDLDKANQYKRNLERQHIQQQLDYENFLKQLDIKLHIKKADKNTIRRIAQLTQKTNQFNLSVKRYTESEIFQLIDDSNYIIYTCEYEDKFGNEGIIGCAIVKIIDKITMLDTFLLSCRVLGRRVEFSFMDFIVNELEISNYSVLETKYSETGKNSMIRTFLNDYGYDIVDETLFIKKIKN